MPEGGTSLLYHPDDIELPEEQRRLVSMTSTGELRHPVQTIVHGDGATERIFKGITVGEGLSADEGEIFMGGEFLTNREAIVKAEESGLIKSFMRESNISEEDAALGKAKLAAIELYGTGKGRIHDYADGAQEWVPEGLAIRGEGPFMIRESQTIATRYPDTDEAEEGFPPQGAKPQRRAHDEMMEKMRSLRESAPTGGRAQQMAQMRAYLGIPEETIVSEVSSDERYEEQQRLQRAQMDAFRIARFQQQAQGFQEGGLSAVTGVGEPKMKEDEDQPLVPKPGNLISRTLGRIRKFFGFAEGGLVAYANAYANGGRVGFTNGGLATAFGVDPDEEDDPSLVRVPGALAAVGRQPAHLPTQSARRGKMTTGIAMERLNEARERLVARLEKTEADKSSQWLAMAQGMLAPTKTGGFGESLGKAAGLLNVTLSEKREQLTAIETDLLDAEIKQQQLTLSSRPRLGSSDDVYHPDDVANMPENPERWRIIQKQTVVHSDGTVEHIFTGTDTGELLQVVTKNNPITVRGAAAAKIAGLEEAKRAQHDIDQGLIATIATDKLRLARDIFATTQTGGLKTLIAKAGDFLNIKIADNADFAMIRRHIGDEVLNQLSRLTGTKTDFEYRKIESLNAGTAIGQEANLRIIDEMMMRYANIINIGERAAIAKATNVDEDLSVFRYREFRANEALRKEQGPQARTPSTTYNDRLVDLFDLTNPNNDQLIEAYGSKYGWPPTDPEVLSELRKKGADL